MHALLSQINKQNSHEKRTHFFCLARTTTREKGTQLKSITLLKKGKDSLCYTTNNMSSMRTTQKAAYAWKQAKKIQLMRKVQISF